MCGLVCFKWHVALRDVVPFAGVMALTLCGSRAVLFSLSNAETS